MIKFLRTFLNLGGPTSNRTVLGTPISYDLKEVAYIKESSNRLTLLHNLYKKYQGTAHEDKIKSAWEKTRKIHAYLVSQKRLHELEMFHLQHTDHFLNTFTLIIDVHQRHQDEASTIISASPATETPASANVTPPRPNINGRQENKSNTTIQADTVTAKAVSLLWQEVTIDANTKIAYKRENKLGKLIPAEIGFTSDAQEKEFFQSFISSKLGIKGIFYVGNAPMQWPYHQHGLAVEMTPVIYWGTHSYALRLHDFLLFPVKIKNKSI